MSSIDKTIREFWLLTVALVLALIAIAFTVYVYVTATSKASEAARRASSVAAGEARDLRCVQRWAEQTSNRSAFLQRYLLPRNDAQVAFEIAIADKEPTATVDRLRDRFVGLSRSYNEQVKAHPLPVPPQLQCARRGAVSVPASPVSPYRPSSASGGGRDGPSASAQTAPVPQRATPTRSAAPSHRPTARTSAPRTPVPRTVTRTRTSTRPAPTSTSSPDPLRSVVCGVLGIIRTCPPEATP